MRVNNVAELYELLHLMIEQKAPMTHEILQDIMCFIFEERNKKDNELSNWVNNAHKLMEKINENK